MIGLDARDVFYVVTGLGFLGFMVLPTLRGARCGRGWRWAWLSWLNVPVVYVAAGMGLAWVWRESAAWVDPGSGDLSLKVVEHAAELIVIVSIAGAGLAVDRPMGRRAWSHTWVLLAVAMPATIAALAGLGVWWLGLPVASAVLLGAALSPTDPVLARSVQVEGPGEGESWGEVEAGGEHRRGEGEDVRVSLTTEAGLNDALAFPFVYLAIGLAAAAGGAEGFDAWGWVRFDVGYRLAGAVGVGWLVGRLMSRFVFGRFGDARRGGENAGLVLLSATFLAYGLTEAVDAYGFLAVFVAARSGRAFARRRGEQDDADDLYARLPHRFSDQVEKVLLALLLLWLGGVSVTGLLDGWRWSELAVAATLILVVRPAAGWVALLPTRGSRWDHAAIAMLGIRGLGTVFYLAYAQGHADFAAVDAVWRTAVLAILLSVALHGVAAELLMEKLARGGS
ncbi:MAG: cation:proton antiporter [Planctomycetota bacterium]